MAFAIPTSPCTTLLTYAELDDHYTQIVGTSAGLIGTTEGQRLAHAADASYWTIVNCLLRRGYTAAQITLWLAGYGHSMHLWLAAYYWATTCGIARDASVWDQAERFMRDWKAICEDGAPIFDANGAIITPDTDRLGADIQARASVQNGSLGCGHSFRFDADPRSMLAGDASTIVGGTRYPNPRSSGGCC